MPKNEIPNSKCFKSQFPKSAYNAELVITRSLCFIQPKPQKSRGLMLQDLTGIEGFLIIFISWTWPGVFCKSSSQTDRSKMIGILKGRSRIAPNVHIILSSLISTAFCTKGRLESDDVLYKPTYIHMKMRYAQIVMGLKGNGKSTYCKLMAKYAESKSRKMRVVNLDATAGLLAYEQPIADIRDVIKIEEFEEADQVLPGSGAGFEHTLSYVLDHPEWLFGAIGEDKDSDYILFDCPGEADFHAHLKTMKVFAAMLVVKNFRTCGVFIRDARLALNGYNFIASCLTPLTSYINLSIPHVSVMMKIDLLSEEDKTKLQLFINSDIKDVLRYENSRNKSSETPKELLELAKLCNTAAAVIDGHNLVRKKYFGLDIREDSSFKGFLAVLDDMMGITED